MDFKLCWLLRMCNATKLRKKLKRLIAFVMVVLLGRWLWMRLQPVVLTLKHLNGNSSLPEETFINKDREINTSHPLKSESEGRDPGIFLLLEFLDWITDVDKGACSKIYMTKTDTCQHLQDGNKYVCFDGSLMPNHGKCLVYSFGIGFDISFDDVMAHFSPSCQIHMFDPTINFTEKLASNQHFHDFGIYHRFVKTHFGNRDLEVFPLSKIVERLGHEGEIIHYLKIDVEGAEWKVFEEMLKSGMFQKVNQIGVEIHMFDIVKEPLRDWPAIIERRHWLLNQLQMEGFYKATFEWNSDCIRSYPGLPENTSLCAEILFVKKKQNK